MKKIIHLITSLEGGGTENFLYQILAHSPPGYAHQVLYLKKDGVIGERIRRRQIGVSPAGSLAALYQTLRRQTPHLLHSCLYSAHLIGRWLGRAAHLPVVTSQRAIDIWQKPWQTWLDTWTLSLSAAVIVNSPAAAHLIEKRRGERARPEVIVIPNGVDTSLFQPSERAAARRRYGIPPQALVAGSLLRLHSEKGADFIPRWAAGLLTRFPLLHLLIGGTGPMEEAIKHQLAGIDYTDRIHWVGWENNAPAFLSACDFFWSLSREESFPQTLVEASVMGLPWIAPEVGGIPDLIQAGAAGLLYPRLAIPQAIEKGAEMVQQLEAWKERAARAVPAISKQYRLQTMVERTYAVFDRLSGKL